MNIPKLINRIQSQITEPPNYNFILDTVNIAISRINTLIEGFDSYITIIQATAGTWGDVTTTWGNTTTAWQSLGKLTDWFDYNATDFALAANSGKILRLKNVYKNGLGLKHVSKESLDLDIYTSNVIALIGRTIYFPADISTGTDVYKIKCILKFGDVTKDTTEYNIPDYFEDLIYNLVIEELSLDAVQVSNAKSYVKAELETAGIKTDIWGDKQ
jgi:hypothetical protein